MTAGETAEGYGIRVTIDDLGDWGATTLVAEYDPHGPRIRVNVRALERMCGVDERARRALVEEAIGHELYHHREAIGEIARQRSRRAREHGAREHTRTFG